MQVKIRCNKIFVCSVLQVLDNNAWELAKSKVLWLLSCCPSFLESAVFFMQEPYLYSKLHHETIWWWVHDGQRSWKLYSCTPLHSAPYTEFFPAPYSMSKAMVNREFLWLLSLNKTWFCSIDSTLFTHTSPGLEEIIEHKGLKSSLLGWQAAWGGKKKQKIVICVCISSLIIPAEHESKIYTRGLSASLTISASITK